MIPKIMYRLISLSECIKTLCLILKTICCKKVDYFSQMFRKYKLKEPKMAAKNFFKTAKTILFFFLSKCETLPNKLVLSGNTIKENTMGKKNKTAKF